jgi:type IV secretion system protein VirB4
LVNAAVQRTAFLEAKADRLHSIEVGWVVMIEGSYRKPGLMRALASCPDSSLDSLRDLRSLFSGNSSRSLVFEQVEPERPGLRQKVQGFSGQMSDLTQIALPGAEESSDTVSQDVRKLGSKAVPGERPESASRLRGLLRRFVRLS